MYFKKRGTIVTISDCWTEERCPRANRNWVIYSCLSPCILLHVWQDFFLNCFTSWSLSFLLRLVTVVPMWCEWFRCNSAVRVFVWITHSGWVDGDVPLPLSSILVFNVLLLLSVSQLQEGSDTRITIMKRGLFVNCF